MEVGGRFDRSVEKARSEGITKVDVMKKSNEPHMYRSYPDEETLNTTFRSYSARRQAVYIIRCGKAHELGIQRWATPCIS